PAPAFKVVQRRAREEMLRIRRAAEFASSWIWLRAFGARRIPARAAPLSDRPADGAPLIVMLVCSSLPIDPRVERESRTLAASGFRVRILCPQWRPVTPAPDWGPGVEIRVLPTGFADEIERFPWALGREFANVAAREPAWCYHAHDLSTALAALTAAARR